MTTAVELQQVTKRYEDVTAVRNLTIGIKEGEFFSLLGPSGCGKTTCLRLIAGFETPTSGAVYLNGQEVSQLPAFRRNVNTVFQSYALFPHLTVARNVAFGLEMKGMDRATITRRVRDALEMVRLPDVGDRLPRQLSGGQQQRVALARALVNRPAVLLLDEPLGALDFKLRKTMQLELKDLQRRVGITFIFVTHDQQEALVMSDRIGVMSEGRLLQVGTPQNIYEHPTSRFVAGFIGDTNFIDGQVAGQEGDSATVKVAEGLHITGYPTAPVTTGQRVTVALRPEKVHITDEQAEAEGVIQECIFMGTDTYLRVELAAGVELAVLHQNTTTTSGSFAKGQRVHLSWQPRSVSVLTE